LDLINENPEKILGRRVADAHGPVLPFLFKVLAAERPLSIQAHPSKSQAEDGWERENERGIPLEAPERNYKDDNHKPELICALTEFQGLCGFRKIDEILVEFLPLGVKDLEPLVEKLKNSPDSKGLKMFFSSLMELPEEKRKKLVPEVVEAIQELEGERYRWVERCSAFYPGDIGSIAPLFLNYFTLTPGEALYLDAGKLHAYLKGVGVEIMANSDNVLRGGCTPKHIDVKELLSVLKFQGSDINTIKGEEKSERTYLYPTPAPEFLLSRIELEEGKTYISQRERVIEILLCVRGNISLQCEDESIRLGKGQSLVIPAESRDYSIDGFGTLYTATIP
jgi:mannose-6-phosphate isomerase